MQQLQRNKPIVGIVLHAYQPPYPVQEPDVVTRIVKNTYLPVPKALLESEIPITVNINGSLSEILEVEHPEVIEAFSALHESNLLEFLGSGCYHPYYRIPGVWGTLLKDHRTHHPRAE